MNKCKVKKCSNSSLPKDRGHGGFCWKHYQQMWKNGRILDRTKYDKQEYIDCGDYYEICLYRGRKEQKEVARALIDKGDLNKVKDMKWCLLNTGYIYSRTGVKAIYLHRLILGDKHGFAIDHINHNTLDNRKANLRYVKHFQNMWNRKSSGCSFDKRTKKWQTYITVNKKHVWLGRFTNKQDAINARRKAEQKYFGEFAYNYNLYILCLK